MPAVILTMGRTVDRIPGPYPYSGPAGRGGDRREKEATP